MIFFLVSKRILQSQCLLFLSHIYFILISSDLDQDMDGYLTRDDLAAALGEKPEQLMSVMQALDPEGKGRVSLSTWVNRFDQVGQRSCQHVK